MFKVKNIAVAAASGFVLSFLISIISTHRAGTSLLRGLIFGLIFAVLGFGIDLLNSKFLEVDAGLGGDSTEDSSNKTSGNGGSKAGSFVNITIDDENLTEEEQAPAFDVSSGRQVFSYKTEQKPSAGTPSGVQSAPVTASATETVTSSAPVQETETAETGSEASGFKPMQLGKPIESGEVVKNDAPQSPEAEVQKSSTGVKEIDALPDIGEFSSSDSEIGDSGSVSSVISDSEFAQGGDMKASAAMTEGGDMMKQDSKIIASAIRTLLKKED